MAGTEAVVAPDRRAGTTAAWAKQGWKVTAVAGMTSRPGTAVCSFFTRLLRFVGPPLFPQHFTDFP